MCKAQQQAGNKANTEFIKLNENKIVNIQSFGFYKNDTFLWININTPWKEKKQIKKIANYLLDGSNPFQGMVCLVLVEKGFPTFTPEKVKSEEELTQ